MTRAYYNGLTMGFEAAGRYLDGTRADRRRVRAYLDRIADNCGHFARGFREAFLDRIDQRLYAIRHGLAPRTIRPGLLGYLLNRY